MLRLDYSLSQRGSERRKPSGPVTQDFEDSQYLQTPITQSFQLRPSLLVSDGCDLHNPANMCEVPSKGTFWSPKARPWNWRYRRPVFVVEFWCLFSVDLVLARRCKEGMPLNHLKCWDCCVLRPPPTLDMLSAWTICFLHWYIKR